MVVPASGRIQVAKPTFQRELLILKFPKREKIVGRNSNPCNTSSISKFSASIAVAKYDLIIINVMPLALFGMRCLYPIRSIGETVQ